MISFLKINTQNIKLFFLLVEKKLTVLLARCFFFSSIGILIVKIVFFPIQFFRYKSKWSLVKKYLLILFPEKNDLKNLFQYTVQMVDVYVWGTLIYNAWDNVLKYNDFSQIEILKKITERGNGLLILGVHHGPRSLGFILKQLGLNPMVLVHGKPDLNKIPFKKLLNNEKIFRGTYDGMLKANHSERQFIRMMMAGRPGMMYGDVNKKRKTLDVTFLDTRLPVGIFPFKLALKHNFPVVLIWISKIKGKGYKLNVKEIKFSTIEEGVMLYGEFLNEVVRSNPFVWHKGPTYFLNNYYKNIRDNKSKK